MSSLNYGRIKILTDMDITGDIERDRVVIPKIIENSLPIHLANQKKYEINEQWYFNDTEKILSKVKHIRPEIDNKFTFSTPKSVVSMNNGYCFGEPFKYVCDEADEELQKQMQAFNRCLKLAKVNNSTLSCAKNTAMYGIGYKLALYPNEQDLKRGLFFKIIGDINNHSTFIVYKNNIEKEPILGVMYYDRKIVGKDGIETSQVETVFNCWTRYHQWVFVKDEKKNYANIPYKTTIDGIETLIDGFPLKLSIEAKAERVNLPLQEYERTGDRIGDYELSIKLMDAINILASCRLDSVQQSTDFIIKLRDIDLGEFDEEGENPVLERIQRYMANHFLAVESRDGAEVQPDIDVLDIPLNQSEVQKLQDYLWEMLLEELQQPTRSGGTGQDTGIAVENRNGFRQFENNAVEITESAIKSEMDFLTTLLEIGKTNKNCPFKDLEVGDISIKPMRNKSENKTASVNNYANMRKAGVNPYTAYAESGLVADITDTIKLDEDWKIKEQEFILEQEIKKQEALSKIKATENNSADNKQTADEQKTE